MTRMQSIARKIKQDLKNDLIAGLLVVIPLATTIWLSYTVALWAIDFFTSIPKQFNPFGALDPLIANLLNIAVGFSVPLVAILLIGLMARNFAGRWLLDTGEKILASIPFAGAIYKTLQQILETLFKDSKSKFRRVVMIEYPRQGVWSIGFVTGTIAPSVQANLAKPCLSVFIPTTPNPTSGWYAIIPEEEAITLDLSIEDAFKILISGGIVSPNTAPSLPIDFPKTRSATNPPFVAIDDPA